MRRLFALLPLIVSTFAQAQMQMGVNVGGGITYYDGRVYGDLMRQAGGWGDSMGRRGLAQELRPDGYPTEVGPSTWKPTAILLQNEPLPAGDYTISARGRGRINLNIDGWSKQLYVDFDGPPRSVVYTAEAPKPPAVQLNVGIQASDPADPIRDVRIVAPDATGSPFSRPVLEDLKGFALLRFMDARGTNNSTHVTWADYTAGLEVFNNRDHRWSFDDCAALCNATGADGWWCIPLLADDDYIRRMAQTIDASLGRGRTIYVEYSNELWNGGFSMYHKMQEAKAALPPPVPSIWTYQGQQAAKKLAIFKAALPASRRCVGVVAAQAGWYGAARETMAGAAGAGGFDAIAFAPYFSMPSSKIAEHAAKYNAAADDAARAAIVGDAIEDCHLDVSAKRDVFRAWRAIADQYKVPLLAYEGGQHLTPSGNTTFAPLLIAINKDPRFESVCLRYLASALAEGVDVFCWYSSQAPYTKNSTWGLREWAGQKPDPPKARAVAPYRKSG